MRHKVNRIPSATLVLVARAGSSPLFLQEETTTFLPGKAVEIRLGYGAQELPVFKGLITKCQLKLRKNQHRLRVACQDEAVRMTIGRKSQHYEAQRESDLLAALIRGHHLGAQLPTTSAWLPEVVQHEATDWEFMRYRAAANGWLVFVADGTVQLAPPDAAQEPVVTLAYGTTLLAFDAAVDARRQSGNWTAHSWSAAEQAMVTAEAAEPGLPRLGNQPQTALAGVPGGARQDVRHGGQLDSAELQAWADARALWERLASVRGRARMPGVAGVRPGQLIAFTGVGEQWQGQTLVTGVRHHVAGGRWQTKVQFGLRPKASVAQSFRRPLPAAGLLPGVGGLHTGIVTRLSGDPAGEDRIKVRLPLISADHEGLWARLATLDAGHDRGTYFRPEINDEVLVGFVHEDPRYPVVLGMCHSSQKPAPTPPADENHVKGYVSRAKLQLRFDDEQKIVTIQTPAGNKLTLSEEEQAIRLEDQQGNRLVLDRTGIRLESSGDILLQAARDVQMTGQGLRLEAKHEFKAFGMSGAELSSDTTTSVKGSAITVIRGGVVLIDETNP
nr:type VI secretion system tip protein VgrG [Hymenobacter norwichensis]